MCELNLKRIFFLHGHIRSFLKFPGRKYSTTVSGLHFTGVDMSDMPARGVKAPTHVTTVSSYYHV